ncbi:ATP-dependent nuclease [Bifidobacterium aerophilum]|uniref:AAA family ATPase n=1 Tax=Bifidobacterium aerophilum TaxID=1798155 RepID=A0A6N9Z5S2_9BIFI|nr:AAA family ATPase [Bifidobacterium aerophilum]NEG89958.1 AAA family ATPase [Bifidobacterium aerophilum]
MSSIKEKYQFKINEIHLNGNISIPPKKANIIIGANNVGKSLFLKEIRDYLFGKENIRKIISNIDHQLPESFDALNSTYNITNKVYKDSNGNWNLKSYSNTIDNYDYMNSIVADIYTQTASGYSNNPCTDIDLCIKNRDNLSFRKLCGSLFFQYLGTEERLSICKMQKNLGVDDYRSNLLSSIKHHPKTLKALSTSTKNIFNKEIYLDTDTLGDRICFRVDENFSHIINQARFNENDVQYICSKPLLDEQGDGLKSFVSTFLSINTDEKDILLLDEPEAFLHPPLARQMGEMIGQACETKDISIYIATHSVEILKGILSKCHDVNIIRLDQKENKFNVKIIPQETLNSVILNPLLRSSKVLEGLFCEKVIVTESDADEIIYQELIEKKSPESGIYFTHSQNKQTSIHITDFYRKVGVHCLIISDFDFIRDTKDVAKFLSECSKIKENDKQQILSEIDKIHDIIKQKFSNSQNIDTQEFDSLEMESTKEWKAYKNMLYHQQGLRAFSGNDEKTLQNILEILQKLGLFIVPSGELETILESFGIEYTSNKQNWIINALQRINEIDKDNIEKSDELNNFLDSIISY